MSAETLAAVEAAISAHIKDDDPETALISWVVFLEAFSHSSDEQIDIMYHISYAVSAGASPSTSVGVATLGHRALMNDIERESR